MYTFNVAVADADAAGDALPLICPPSFLFVFPHGLFSFPAPFEGFLYS